MGVEPSRHCRPRAERDAGRGRDRQCRQTGRRDETCRGLAGHPEAAGRHQEQDASDLESAEMTMPARETGARPFPDQGQPQDQRNGAGQDVRVERPSIHAQEVAFSTAQEVRRVIRREIMFIIRDHARGDLDDQDARQDGEDAARRCPKVWAHGSAESSRASIDFSSGGSDGTDRRSPRLVVHGPSSAPTTSSTGDDSAPTRTVRAVARTSAPAIARTVHRPGQRPGIDSASKLE